MKKMCKMIIGNWKMNPETEDEALALVGALADRLKDVEHLSIGVAPPFVFLEKAANMLKDSELRLGAQDVFWEDKGAYTGEISVEELKSIGVEFVIIGHSERREMGETDREINRKVRKALKGGLMVILCVGEAEDMRNRGIDVAKKFVSGELEKDLEKTGTVLKRYPGNLVIAYEPLWAISGKEGSEPAESEKAVEMISFIKKFLEVNSFGEGEKTRVLYGGSVGSDNAGVFLRREEVGGVLVGAASLKAEEFSEIVNIPR